MPQKVIKWFEVYMKLSFEGLCLAYTAERMSPHFCSLCSVHHGHFYFSRQHPSRSATADPPPLSGPHSSMNPTTNSLGNYGADMSNPQGRGDLEDREWLQFRWPWMSSELQNLVKNCFCFFTGSLFQNSDSDWENSTKQNCDGQLLRCLSSVVGKGSLQPSAPPRCVSALDRSCPVPQIPQTCPAVSDANGIKLAFFPRRLLRAI